VLLVTGDNKKGRKERGGRRRRKGEEEEKGEKALDDDVEGNIEERAPAVIGAGWPQISLPSIMRQPELIARRPAGLGPPIVEQAMIGIVTSSEAPLARKARKRGDRGQDSKTRAKRRCRRCLQNNGDNAQICDGGKARSSQACQYFD
jgi:hypothetical protein